jgi:hypothetical protein
LKWDSFQFLENCSADRYPSFIENYVLQNPGVLPLFGKLEPFDWLRTGFQD